MFSKYPDLRILKYAQNKVLKSLQQGEITDLQISCKMPVDHIVDYGLKKGLVQSGLKSFPDPRKYFNIPIEVLLLPQVIQSLNNEQSILTAPYMLNSAELIIKLGYSAKVLTEGFNNKNIYPRECPFHGETLKHVLLGTNSNKIVDWFNKDWSQLIKAHSPGDVRHYVIDGMNIHVPSHLYKKFQGSGMIKKQGKYEYGYKVVWIYELIDRKGIIRSMKFSPINTHDVVLGKELVKDFDFAKHSVVIMDRGFIDGEWITSLKRDRAIELCIPLRRNMLLSELAIYNDTVESDWKEHPTREGQRIRELSDDELVWKKCPVFQSGVLINFKKKDSTNENIVIMDTRKGIEGKKLLETYDLRCEIEEAHRQMKCFQGLEKLPSKKYVQVVFRIVMSAIGYNLFNLFLNSEDCATFKDYSLKLLRQKRRRENEKNPDIIIYTDTSYATLKILDFLKMILGLTKRVQEKLQFLCNKLSQAP